jgi:hypothetical protein
VTCKHPPALRALVKKVQACLTDDLLSPEERAKPRSSKVAGHCAVASEAVWAAKARRLGYKTRVARTTSGGTHWWLVSPKGCVLDPTAAQFSKAERERLYAAGRGAGPQGVRYSSDGTLIPSKRAREVLRRMR